MDRPVATVGAVFCLFVVLIGAFGAHGLKDHFAAHPSLERHFQTAIFFHAIHAIVLLGLGFAGGSVSRSPARFGAWGMGSGVFLFSGSLYALAFTGKKTLGAITPIGGLLFVFGWIALIISIHKR